MEAFRKLRARQPELDRLSQGSGSFADGGAATSMCSCGGPSRAAATEAGAHDPQNENAHRPGRAPSTASNAGRTLPLGTDANKASTAAAWPELLPLPQARAVVPALTPDLLPPALRPWLADLSERDAGAA